MHLTFRKIYDDTLARGGSLAYWPPQHREPSEGVVQIDGTYNVWAKKPSNRLTKHPFLLGADPSTASIEKTAELKAGEAIAWGSTAARGSWSGGVRTRPISRSSPSTS